MLTLMWQTNLGEKTNKVSNKAKSKEEKKKAGQRNNIPHKQKSQLSRLLLRINNVLNSSSQFHVNIYFFSY